MVGIGRVYNAYNAHRVADIAERHGGIQKDDTSFYRHPDQWGSPGSGWA